MPRRKEGAGEAVEVSHFGKSAPFCNFAAKTNRGSSSSLPDVPKPFTRPLYSVCECFKRAKRDDADSANFRTAANSVLALIWDTSIDRPSGTYHLIQRGTIKV